MIEFLFGFVYLYPFFMALFWMLGAGVFILRREIRQKPLEKLEHYPKVSVLVPCRNEELAIADTLRCLARNNYPEFDIIAIDDGSGDATWSLLEQLATEIPMLRIIRMERNFGKAKALNMGAMASDAEYLACIDADSLLEVDALEWMVSALEAVPRAGAVTGNPRVLNRITLLSRIQVGEFSAIVGMIKRAQRLLGRVYTVSGVCACFRARAVHEVGYWSSETVTDDVDISWRLQLGYWGVLYEPRALCWILVPETMRDLWRQRVRWSRGGIEAWLRHRRGLLDWKKRRMWPVLVELAISTVWCYSVALVVVLFALTWTLGDFVPEAIRVRTLLPGWTGSLLAVTCLVQFACGLLFDAHYEGKRLLLSLYWAIWYPAAYWLLNAAAAVVAVPIALKNFGRYRYAVWKSPDR